MVRPSRSFPFAIVFAVVLAAAAAFLAEARPVQAQSGSWTVEPDLVYGHKDGMALTMDAFRPTGERNGAAVLYMVSGGWVSSWRPPEDTARAFEGLLEAGFTVFAVRHGSSPRFKVPDAENDVDRALRYVHSRAGELGVDPDRLGVFGGSAGGHLSLMLGLDPNEGDAAATDPVLTAPSRVAAVVAYFPPVDLRQMAGPSRAFPALDFPPDEAASISPILFVSPDDPPTLLIHGDADRLVPISHSERMYAALQEAGVTSEFITIEGGDHGFSVPEDRAEAIGAMVAWFVRYLGG